MNSVSHRSIKTYKDLKEERERLEELIKGQKLLVRQDLDDLKDEAEVKLKPVFEAADFVKKLTNPATRNDTLVGIGTNLTLDILIRRLFMKTNFLMQLLVPPLLKNYSTHLLFDLLKKISRRRRNGRSNGQPIESVTYVVRDSDLS